MSERDVEREREADDDAPADVSPCYQAYVERNEHRPDSCTIYSAVNAESMSGAWIRAFEGAFRSLDDAR